jgi:soluble lytic murein transglycosylase-like protein
MGQEIIARVLPLLALLLVNNNQVTARPQDNTSYNILSETTRQRNVYVVKEQDTLTSIASNFYGKEDYAVLVLSDNLWIKDPNNIETGWKLKMRSRVLKAEDLLDMENAEDAKNKIQIAEAKYTYTNNYYSLNNSPAHAAAVKYIQSVPVQTGSTNYEDVYKQAGEKYGIPWQILYGLHLTETGQRDGTIYNNQGSGARGPMQFMPGTFGAYAVDGDGDGMPNIDNAKDAIYTAANYLAKHGSLDNGLRSYGGNTPGVLAAARSKGFIQ